MFGVPAQLLPVLRSGLLSPAGLLRAAGDLILPRSRLPLDPSVAELLRPRFGQQVLDRLIEPLLGGVHAGHASLLSARSTIGEVAAIADRSRSVYLGLRRTRRYGSGPVLVSLAGGLVSLVDALVTRSPTSAGVRLRSPFTRVPGW